MKFFLSPCRPHPLFFKMSQDFVFLDSCTPVHGILFLLQIHVRTWNFVSSSNPCTWVNGILFFLQIHVHESEKIKSLDILKKKGWGWHRAKKNFSFVSFFVDPKSNFLKKTKIKVALWRFGSIFLKQVFLFQ